MQNFTKRIVPFFAIMIALIAILISPSASAGYEWKTWATFNKNGVTMFRLEAGVNKGDVKWRIVNDSDRAIYDVSIGDKEYKLSSGRTVKASGEWIANKIDSGQTKGPMVSDSPGARDDSTVTGYRIIKPIITFAIKPGGDRDTLENIFDVKFP